MTSSSPNIKFCYLYRDGGNYKQYNEVIFSNPNKISLPEIEKQIRQNLIDGEWFIAKKWGIADMHFKELIWDNDVDHDWHEFIGIEETIEIKTETKSLEIFLALITGKKEYLLC